MTEFAFPAVLTQGGSVDTLTAFNFESDKPVYTTNSRHPNWNAILDGLRTGDPTVWEKFNVAKGIMAHFEQVTDRISWDGENVLWDGDPFVKPVAEHLSRCIQDGDSENYTAFAKFVEKLETNPNDHSREQTYDFLASHSFQITGEGDVVGYKGVQYTDQEGVFRSGRRSEAAGKPSAFVNGVALPELSYVTQRVGDVVSLPRSEVVHDPSKACERGLHVSTRTYAKSWANNGVVLEIHANPRDFVSVPDGARGEKVRVHRYTVARVSESENTAANPVVNVRRETRYTWTPDVSYRG